MATSKEEEKRVEKVKKKLNLKKSLETFFDENGRECTRCGSYKTWGLFGISRKTATGRQSVCKECKNSRAKMTRKAKGRRKENYSAKKRREFLKETRPLYWRANNIRSSLMRRAREAGMPIEDIASRDVIEQWLKDQEPLVCYYTNKPIDILESHIDHKVPLKRGGGNSLDNLCVTDPKINSAKGAMTEEEFKSLLKLIGTWEDEGVYLLSRLRMGHFGKLK